MSRGFLTCSLLDFCLLVMTTSKGAAPDFEAR